MKYKLEEYLEELIEDKIRKNSSKMEKQAEDRNKIRGLRDRRKKKIEDEDDNK